MIGVLVESGLGVELRSENIPCPLNSHLNYKIKIGQTASAFIALSGIPSQELWLYN